MPFTNAKLIIFDLDSTLAESKSKISHSMTEVLQTLLVQKKVAIISGGNFPQFEKQVLASFPHEEHFQNLFLMPTTGTRLYMYMNKTWSLVYSKDLTPEDKEKIRDAFSEVFLKMNYKVTENVYGELIEDRDSQITFSALGQDAPLDRKSTWDPDRSKRAEMVRELKKIIPEFSIQIGGTTSIDVTAENTNKATGINSIQKYLGLSDEEVIFVGDALYPGGNDYPAISTGVECIKVENPADTERLIRSWL